jgi:hypothetical protein
MTRSLLHLSKLPAFQQFCEARGWRNEPIKGPYEKLRMTKEGREVLIVYAKLRATEHCTTHGVAEAMARAFVGQRKEVA